MRALISAALGGYLASRFSSSSSKHAHHSTPNVIQQERPSSAKSGNDSPAAAAEQRPPPPCSHQIELFAPSFSPVPDQKIEAKRVRGGGTNALCELGIKQASNISSSSSSGNNEHINNIVSSRRRRKRRSQYSIDVASDGTVMNIMEFADLPSALSLMQASNRIREALCGKLRHRFWEMTFWRDRGILLYFNQFSMIPRTLSHLPNDPKSWQWNHFMQAYYSSDYAARSRKHRMFGRFSYPHNARRLHNPPQRQQQPQHPQHQQHLDNKQVGNSWEFSPSSSSSSPFSTPSLMFDTQ
mmetsp:Transcript_38499/g.62558  ORF Transcript_38499/g.62558 Transcript_38499/m.62558 type:complete len:297 (-) Transcript_38499:482-1372(-)